MDRIILHCDLNNFFASVSLLFNPTLASLPVAVCGDEENRHGIVLAKNELAKSYGVKTAQPIFEAKKKCPHLVTLPPIYHEYRRYSELVRDIYARYTDMIEPFGIDECWLDVSGSLLLFGDGKTIADRIRRDIKTELGITASVGVSFNKVFAKLGSDYKKPNATTVISRENFKEIVWPLPVSDLLFAGRRSTEKLNSSGIFTIGDVALCSDTTVKRLLGKGGVELQKYARGEDTSPVVTPKEDDKPKSISRSVTLSNDFCDYESIRRTFLTLSESISDSLRKHSLYAAGISVHLRTASLSVKEFSKLHTDTTDSAYLIANRGMELVKKNYPLTEPLRSVGIGVYKLSSVESAVQEDIFGDRQKDLTQEKIDRSLYEVRKKFGKGSIARASAVDPDET